MSNDAMIVTLRKVHDILVVELPAALNAETRPHINEKVEYAMADTPGALILDFGRVTAADADGLKALHFAITRAAEIDMPLALTGMGPSIRPLVEGAGYLDHAKAFATVDEAVASGL